MSAFMESIEGDIDDVFFDTDFFAHIHLINGKDIPVIADESELMEALKKDYGRGDRGDGIFKDETRLFVRKSDIGETRLKINSIMEVDGRDLFVHDTKEEEGVFKITLGRYQV